MRVLLLLLLQMLLPRVLYGSHAKAVNRRHRGALCSACVGCAVRCACGAVTHPKAQSSTCTFFADRSRLQRKKQYLVHRTPASACCSIRQSTRRCHRCCIFCTLSGLRRMTLPAFAAASRWHGLDARAMPLVRNEL